MNIKTMLLGLAGVLSAWMLSSCKDSDRKSLSELKDEQANAINDFIKTNNLKVVALSTNELPANPSSDTYYLLKNGLYICVKQAGDLTKLAKRDTTHVYVRTKGYQFREGSGQLATFDNLSKGGVVEIQFRYTYYYNAGDLHFIPVPSSRPVGNLDALMCEGMAFPVSLSNIGDGAILSLIIPFELGPSSTYSSGITTYISELRYTYAIK